MKIDELIKNNKDTFKNILLEISRLDGKDVEAVQRIIFKNTSSEGKLFKKSQILAAYKYLDGSEEINLTDEEKKVVIDNIVMKKIRTLSGVAPVTVLTKPYPCPGKCIFCPSDVRMPKSYVSSEPGAQRAENNKFDPYYQTYNRMVALKSIGHSIDKVELIILGGTWTSYPEEYRIWFVKRCFDAMNDISFVENPKVLDPVDLKMPFHDSEESSEKEDKVKNEYNKKVTKAAIRDPGFIGEQTATWEELENSHKKNETSKVRCVGLVIETRPDEISKEEVIRIRRLGATKIQLGIQSLDDKVLELNQRGHDVKKTQESFELIRAVGFKIHGHWMANLYGSDVQKDREDYKKLFADKRFRPDELKIYPCSLLGSAELMNYYKKGLWKPYTEEELLDVLKECYKNTPRYCRLTRVIRDIPSTDIIHGNKKTNFRQIVENALDKEGYRRIDIRSREIRDTKINKSDFKIKTTEYETTNTNELFIEFADQNEKIAGFMRLSFLDPGYEQFIDELKDCAMIREIHIYGESLDIGDSLSGKAQHIGFGRDLIQKSKEIARKRGYKKLCVISSVGTREYYRKNGFKDGKLYQYLDI